MKPSNASASAFGWDFQSNAAIILMLKNIERASKVKVEGLTECPLTRKIMKKVAKLNEIIE
jgi:hypothetical protein